MHQSRFSWFRMTTICLALLLEGMCSSSINVQIGDIRESLGPGRIELGLIVSTFLVAYAGLLPAAGGLVDAWNRRTVFLVGVATFGVGCLLCASAVGPWMLIGGRFVQGAGAALSAPAALALITSGLPAGSTRNRAVALYGAMGAAGFSLGLVVPGFVVARYGWRVSFLMFVPVVLAVLVLTYGVRCAPTNDRRRVDLVGAAFLTVILMVALHGIGGIGTSPGWLLGAEILVVVALATGLRRRGGVVGFPAQVMRLPVVRSSCAGLAAVFAGVVSSMYVVSLGLQLRDGADAAEVGLTILPQPIAFSVLSGFGARLVTRFGPGAVMNAGMLLVAVALAHLGIAAGRLPTFAGVLPAMTLIGAGLALSYPAASIGAVDAAPADHRGTTAGLLTTWQNVGGATGIALVTALALVPEPAARTDSARGVYVSAGLVVIGGLAARILTTRSRSPLAERHLHACPARHRA
jgi:MFS family permease